MRIGLTLSALCLLGACAPFPQDPNAPPRQPRYTTGSNLPRVGQADSVDPEAVNNQLRFGTPVIPSQGGAGR